ncbi:MAG: hypothetical protein EZS28_023307 [Streblomastix strix]|uniref:Calcineurin-like phosphoesterase domain-containing protein n=1 Tax=Streblomastix strix TaxID=222440 RepID=A0A5J4VF34_9EUKA|nr:MAG: hypothetical protein EZS28_023307 [Streblomastix strix]
MVDGHRHIPELDADIVDYYNFVRHTKELLTNHIVLAFDSGDQTQGTGLSDLTQIPGEFIFEMLKQVPIDGFTIVQIEMKGRYIVSNSHHIDQNKKLGEKYKIMDIKGFGSILVLGYIFSFTGYMDHAYVTPVPDSIKEEWLKDVLNNKQQLEDESSTLKLVILLIHCDPANPETDLIVNQIREYRPDLPILVLGGHSHDERIVMKTHQIESQKNDGGKDIRIEIELIKDKDKDSNHEYDIVTSSYDCPRISEIFQTIIIILLVIAIIIIIALLLFIFWHRIRSNRTRTGLADDVDTSGVENGLPVKKLNFSQTNVIPFGRRAPRRAVGLTNRTAHDIQEQKTLEEKGMNTAALGRFKKLDLVDPYQPIAYDIKRLTPSQYTDVGPFMKIGSSFNNSDAFYQHEAYEASLRRGTSETLVSTTSPIFKQPSTAIYQPIAPSVQSYAPQWSYRLSESYSKPIDLIATKNTMVGGRSGSVGTIKSDGTLGDTRIRIREWNQKQGGWNDIGDGKQQLREQLVLGAQSEGGWRKNEEGTVLVPTHDHQPNRELGADFQRRKAAEIPSSQMQPNINYHQLSNDESQKVYNPPQPIPPTKFGRTDYRSRLPMHQPIKESAMYGGGPDIYKPTYRTMLDKPIGKEDDLLHKQRYENKLAQRRMNENRILNTYAWEEEQKEKHDQGRWSKRREEQKIYNDNAAAHDHRESEPLLKSGDPE